MVKLNSNKQMFLDSIRAEGLTESTIKSITQFLQRMVLYEIDVIEKDLCVATTQEILNFLGSFDKVASLDSLKVYYNFIQRYILFCTQIQVPNTNTTFYEEITESNLQEVLTGVKNKYLTPQEFVELVEKLEDYRDKVIVSLVYYGFYDVELKSLSLLTIQDVMSLNRNMDSFLKNIIEKSILEKYVHTYSEWKEGIDELIPSEYIIRERKGFADRKDIIGNSRRESFNGYSMNKNSLINRLTKLKKHLDIQDISYLSLYISGVVNRTLNSIDTNSIRFRKDFIESIRDKERIGVGSAYKYFKVAVNEIMPKIKEEKKNSSGLQIKEKIM